LGDITFELVGTPSTLTGAVIVNFTQGNGTIFCYPKPPIATRGLVQKIYADTADNTQYTTVIPVDDTIPLWNEGSLFLQATITPRFFPSKIIISFQGFGSGGVMVAALFRNGTNPGDAAICAAASRPSGAAYPAPLSLVYQDTLTLPDPTIYQIRVGSSTMRMNGVNTARYFGGVARSTLILEEIKI